MTMLQAQAMTAAAGDALTKAGLVVMGLKLKDELCHIKTCDALDAVAAAEEALAAAKAAVVEAQKEGAAVTDELWAAQKEAFAADRTLRMAQADELRLTPMSFITISTPSGLSFSTTGVKGSDVVLERTAQIFKINRITEGEHEGCVELEAHGGEANGLLLNNCGGEFKKLIMWNRKASNGLSKSSLWSIEGDILLSQTNNPTNPIKRAVKVKGDKISFAAAGEEGQTFVIRRASSFFS
jgi:hypothetical protein